jgi:hypothetical protein
MKLTAKVTRIDRGRFISIKCSIVNNYRDGHGRPRNRVLFAAKTIRSTELSSETVKARFWKEVDKGILRVVISNGGIMQNDIEAIKKRFAEIVPRPSIRLQTSIPQPIIKPTTRDELFRRYPILKA